MPTKGWIIRDADYDVDKLGYGLIKSKTILYHATLFAKAKSNAKGNEPTPEHVEQAEAEINQEVYVKLRQQEMSKKSRLPSLKDLSIAVGSGFIGIFCGKLIELLVNNQPIQDMHWAYWLSLALSIICFIPYLRAEN